MAKTSGHGNAAWTRDETILALELLVDLDYRVGDKSDPRVIELSNYLRSLPLHPAEKKNQSFRNPDGVSFKLQNLVAVQTGRGLMNVSQVDREVWEELGASPGRVRELAKQIRQDSHTLEAIEQGAADLDEDEVFSEGATATKLHFARERNRNIRKRLLASRMKWGLLRCEACGEGGPKIDTAYTRAIFEAHHTVPLSSSGATATRLSEVALLCANCHRLIHRAMVVQKRWIGIPEFSALIGSQWK